MESTTACVIWVKSEAGASRRWRMAVHGVGPADATEGASSVAMSEAEREDIEASE
jgi:hypothetical protein